MYYCGRCAETYSYPETSSQSFGKCEICYRNTTCSTLADRSLINVHRDRADGLRNAIEEIFKVE